MRAIDYLRAHVSTREVVKMGNYFEDFTPGQTFKHWPGRTLTDFDNTWFTLMTMNTNPIHFDAAYAAKSQYGRCLVNGLLVIATVTGMSVKDISENAIANLEYETIRHTAPTFGGDTLYAETTVLAVVKQTGSRSSVRRDSRTQSEGRAGADAAAPGAGAATAAMKVAAGSDRRRREAEGIILGESSIDAEI
jgi:acyl dehydratase